MKTIRMSYLVGLVTSAFDANLEALKSSDEVLTKVNLQESASGVQASVMVNREMTVVRVGFLDTNSFKYMGLNTSVFTPEKIKSSIELFIQSHIGLHELEIQARVDDPNWDQEEWRTEPVTLPFFNEHQDVNEILKS